MANLPVGPKTKRSGSYDKMNKKYQSKNKKTRSSKKVSKHYPVQRIIRPWEITAGAVAHIVRGDKLLSNVNHRLYRQSRVYEMKVTIEPDWTDRGVQSMNVYALADTWINQKAYQMAYKTFQENSKEELEQLGASAARWNDFRVDHGLPIGATNFSETKAYQFEPNGGPPGGDKVFIDEGEYLNSQITNAAGTTQTFRWTGSSTNGWNIIDQYDLTGNTDASPTVAPAEVAYDGLTDELDDNQMSHLSNHGNLPPYAETDLPNACWVLVGVISAGSPNTIRSSTGFFKAPCGLVLLEGLSPVIDGIEIEFKKGDYKGVSAPSYLE